MNRTSKDCKIKETEVASIQKFEDKIKVSCYSLKSVVRHTLHCCVDDGRDRQRPGRVPGHRRTGGADLPDRGALAGEICRALHALRNVSI